MAVDTVSSKDNDKSSCFAVITKAKSSQILIRSDSENFLSLFFHYLIN
jgi:hypothetical protein